MRFSSAVLALTVSAALFPALSPLPLQLSCIDFWESAHHKAGVCGAELLFREGVRKRKLQDAVPSVVTVWRTGATPSLT